MPNTIDSVYMSMPVPVPTVDPGPQYATDLNTCLGIVDSHTHAPGQGQQITPAGINITTDLSFGGNNAINLRSSRYTIQGGALNAGSDIACTYVTGFDLWYNDVNGNQVRLTQNGGVAGTPGSIGNLFAPASVTYVTGTQTFVFQSSTATAGNIDVGSVTIREVAANANGIKISSPSSLSANYTLILPPALPANTRIPTIDVSGNILFVGSSGSKGQALVASTSVTPGYDFSNVVVPFPGFGNLRVIRGIIGTTGGTESGEGFTATAPGGGGYNVMFNTPFVDFPAVTVTPYSGTPQLAANIGSISSSAFQVNIFTALGAGQDSRISFIAIGRV